MGYISYFSCVRLVLLNKTLQGDDEVLVIINPISLGLIIYYTSGPYGPI